MADGNIHHSAGGKSAPVNKGEDARRGTLLAVQPASWRCKLIKPKDYDRWLQQTESEAMPLNLLRPFPGNSRVGNARNDEEALVVCDDAPTLWG